MNTYVIRAAGRRRLAAIVVAAAASTASCGDDGENGDSGALFTTDQLEALVAQAGDAPPSTRYDAAQSGPASLDLLSQGVESARSMFEELGYQGGQSAIFVSTDPPPPVGAVIGNGVFLFEDAAAASEALDVHTSVVVPEVLQGYEEIPVEGLGDEQFAFTFESGPAGGAGAIYEFRIGNAVFLVPGSGESMDRDALFELAQTVAARVPR